VQQQQQQQQQYHQDDTYIVPVVAAAQPYQEPPSNQLDNSNKNRSSELGQGAAATETYARNEPLIQNQPEAYSNGSNPQLNGNVGNGNANILAVNAAGFPKSESAHETGALAVPEMEAEVPPLSATTDEDSLWSRETPMRPTNNTVRNDSVATISNLHIPGGYPKSTVAEL
jgi:hypothetical protein